MPVLPPFRKFRKVKKGRVAAVAIVLLVAIIISALFLLNLLPSPGTLQNLFEPKAAAAPVSTFAEGAEPLRALMSPPLVAMFSYAPAELSLPLTVRFLDHSRGGPGSWRWDFGDGTTSSEQHPVHTYGAMGDYRVTLTVTRDDGSVRTFAHNDILGSARPSPQLVLVDTLREGTVGKGAEVTFVSADPNSSVTIDGTAYALPAGSVVRMRTGAESAGRMNIRSGRLASFEFPSVTLFVNGSQVARGRGGDCVLPAITSFSANLSYAVRPAGGEIRQIILDGARIRAGMENSLVQILYNPHGITGDLTLVTHPAFFEGAVASFVLSDAVIAGFEPSGRLTGPAPFSVTFRDSSAGFPDRWAWDFGDGTTSFEQHPVHVYQTPGAYTVTLRVTRGDQADTLVRKRAVIAEPPRVVADLMADPVSGPAPLTVQFTDLSTNSPTMWSWTFGPGSVPLNSSEKDPVVTYTVPGTYTVFLTAGNIYGSSDVTKPQIVTVTSPFWTPDKTIVVRTGKRGYIEKGSVLEFVVLELPATISMNGGDRQFAKGDVIRLIAKSDQQGEILMDRGGILKFGFPDMALYVNGKMITTGSVDSIYVPSPGSMKTSLSYYLVPNSAYTFIEVSGYPVLSDLDNAWIRISNLGMDGKGNLRLISTINSTTIDGAMYETVHDWVIG